MEKQHSGQTHSHLTQIKGKYPSRQAPADSSRPSHQPRNLQTDHLSYPYPLHLRTLHHIQEPSRCTYRRMDLGIEAADQGVVRTVVVMVQGTRTRGSERMCCKAGCNAGERRRSCALGCWEHEGHWRGLWGPGFGSNIREREQQRIQRALKINWKIE